MQTITGTITGKLERLAHVKDSTWSLKIQGRRAVKVTSDMLDSVWLNYHTMYTVTFDGQRNAVSVAAA